jgi:pimeloyl-ACP methyl ester carboxylesterase
MKGFLIVLGGVVALLALAALVGFLVLRRPDIPFETLEARYGVATSRFVDLPGGLRAHYRDDGDAGRPVVILIHGFGDSFLSWDGWIDVLARDFRVLTVDMPGHGLTRAPIDYQPSAAAHVDFVLAFAKAVGVDRFAIAGNSMGGGIAWRTALASPDQVSALVLLNAAGFSNDTPSAPPLAFRLLGTPFGRFLLETIETRPLTALALKSNVADDALITTAFVDRWVAVQRAPGHRAILMRGAPGPEADAQALSTIRVPTWVAWGEDDHLLRLENAWKFSGAIAGAQLGIYAGVGHMPQIEIPAQSATDAATFLRGALGVAASSPD